MTESGKYNVHTDKALYEGKGSGCFLLRCNISELHPDDMAAQSGLGPSKVLSALMRLELLGLIEQTDGRNYILK